MVLRPAAVLTAALLAPGLGLLTGCGTDEPAEPLLTRGCMVSSPAGFDDGSIGQLSFGEVSNAQRSAYLGSTSTQRVDTPADTGAALERYAGEGCTLTTLLGPGAADQLAAVAAAHPEQAYLAVGTGGAGPEGTSFGENVITIDFDLLEPAFIAGYIAAASSETGMVAAYSSHGFENSRALLRAFDEGVALYNSEAEADVTTQRSGQIAARTVADTTAAGYDITGEAVAAGADVIVPFASGAASGARAWFEEHYFPPRDDAAGQPDPEADGRPEASGAPQEQEVRRQLVWYGADGSETLGKVGRYVIASIVPNIAAGFQTTIAGWPQTGFAGELAPAQEAPLRIGDLTVRAHSYRGTVENGGVTLTATDGPLTEVAGVGREITDLQERIRTGEVRLP